MLPSTSAATHSRHIRLPACLHGRSRLWVSRHDRRAKRSRDSKADVSDVKPPPDSQERGSNAVSNPDTAAPDPWDAPGTSDEWQEVPARTWRDIDWGFSLLVGVILVLSFGAFRIFNHFSLYASQRRSADASARWQTAGVVDRSASASKALKAKHKAVQGLKSEQSAQPSSSSKQQQPTPAVEGEPAPPAGQQAQQPRGTKAPQGGAAAAPAAPLAGPSLQGVPGLPQPSPVDAGFSQPEAPWMGRDLGSLSLAPLQQLQDGTLQLPQLKPLQVERPAHAVDPAEADALPPDASVPSMRERASMAVRASSAATEAAQRAAAFSAAASSAATRAAEAAEKAAAASAAVQVALDKAAEDAMAAAVARMNKAVEMVADAESRAASAAALATAHQDIAEGQAAVAARAAHVPQPMQRGASGTPRERRDVGSARDRVHAQLFSVWAITQDWAAGVAEAAAALLQRIAAWLASVWARVAF